MEMKLWLRVSAVGLGPLYTLKAESRLCHCFNTNTNVLDHRAKNSCLSKYLWITLYLVTHTLKFKGTGSYWGNEEENWFDIWFCCGLPFCC